MKKFIAALLRQRFVALPLEWVWMRRNRRSIPAARPGLVRPPEITIEVTNICNANCVFCGYQFQDRVKGIMDLPTFQRIVDQYVAVGGGMIELTPVVGDALVDKHLEEKIRYARSFPQITKISFITNAILLTPARFESLGEAGVTHLGISISSLNEAEYRKVYRVDRYPTVLRHLTAIAALPTFSRISVQIGIRSGRPFGWRRDPDLLRLRALGYRSIGATLMFDNWSGRIRDEDLPGAMFVRPPRRKRAPCWQLYNSTTIMSDGRMTACGCRDLNGTSELALGSIHEQSLDAPWKDGRMEALRQRFRDNNPPDVCRDCRHYVPVRESSAAR